MRFYHCLCCRKVTPETPIHPEIPTWTELCAQKTEGFLPKGETGETQFVTEEHTECVLFLRTLFLLSYFFPLHLKWIIQSMSLFHIRLYQFDFAWCRGEGKQWCDVTCTLSWVLFVSTRARWNKASERPMVKDSHCFVNAYANVLEDYIWEKAFQAVTGSTHIFPLRAELIRPHWQKGGDDANLQVRGLVTDRHNT